MARCRACEKEVKSPGSGFKYCSDECRSSCIPSYPCANLDCTKIIKSSNKNPYKRKKFCSASCRAVSTNIQKRTCRKCGNDFQYDHKITPFRWYCDEHSVKECLGENCIVELPHLGPDYCSDRCRSIVAELNGKRQQVWSTCLCGKTFRKYLTRDGKPGGGRGTLYCCQECREKFQKPHPLFSPEHRAKISAARKGKPLLKLRGYKQSEGHLLKRLGNGAIKPSKEELSLVPTMKRLGFRHTGDGTFWRRWKDGTVHNPDFVDEDNKRVMEYFGSFWHEGERGQEEHIRQQWAKIGWDCVILWSEDRQAFLDNPLAFSSTFAVGR